MSKIKSFLSKPITWGGYLKFYAGCCIAVYAMMALWWAWFSRKILRGSLTTDDQEEEEPAYSWTDED